jgi:hypothetical protein
MPSAVFFGNAKRRPFPYQVVFACNQPNDLVAWAEGQDRAAVEPDSMDYGALTGHIIETRARILATLPHLHESLGKSEKRIDLPGDQCLRLSGNEFVEGFLMPNFYFHMVTAYGLMRMIGVDVG